MYEFDDDEGSIQPYSMKVWPEVLVRVIGIILLLVGLWASIQILLEALRLYRDPVNIERLALAIERGSNLEKALTQSRPGETTVIRDAVSSPAQGNQQVGANIRFTYFLAWIVALVILMLVAMIALSFIRSGSELVLQDKQMKHYLRQLIKQGEKTKTR